MIFSRPRLGVGTKTLVALTLVFWIPVGALGGYLYHMFGGMLQNEGIKHAHVLLKGAHNVIDERVSRVSGLLNQIVSTREFQLAMATRDLTTIQTTLLEQGKQHSYISILTAVDNSQRVLSRRNDQRGDSISIGETLSAALRSGEPRDATELVGRNFLSREDEVLGRLVENLGLVRFVVMPVIHDNHIVGALVAGLVISTDTWIGNTVYSRYGGEMAIFAGNPRDALQLHATTSLPRSTWVLGQLLPKQVHQLIELGRPYARTLTIEGRTVIAAFEPIMDSRNRIIGAIGVSVPHDEVDAAVLSTLAKAIAMTSFIALLIALASVFFVHHDITHPLRLLQEAMKRFGDGDFSTRLDLKTGDQLEDLGDRFNIMANDIWRRDQRFKKHNEIAKLFMSTLDMTELLDKTLSIVASVTESQVGILYLVDEIDQFMVPQAQYGTSLDLEPFPMGEGLPGVAAKEKRSLFVDVAEREVSDACIHTGFMSLAPKEVVYIPLVYMDKVLGVLMLGSTRHYPEDELQLFDHLADQIAMAIDNAKMHQRIKELSITDGLTGLSNRRYLNERLEQEWARAARSNLPISLLLSDIDNFKSINDQYGHDKGDVVLKEVAEIFKSNARKEDIVARYGGEEFVIVLPNATTEQACQLAQRICETSRAKEYPWLDRKVTLSIGVSTVTDIDEEHSESLVLAADQAMYKAKSSGKDQVVLAEEVTVHG